MTDRLTQLEIAARECKQLKNETPQVVLRDPLPAAHCGGIERPYDPMMDPTVTPGDANGHLLLHSIGNGQDAG